ncbi:glycosyltransferase family A protein [Cellulomonas aerilata]|uniref:4,4'-diaponeurosporenoate glycosyltransferase n=1 Tax=Cellulomonas aerilata TaxID=515326 RepID=A0A512DC30_9CELL|nr:glycosyltransferase family A protein [Cellulomonas aerilata]GEO34034.1 glycosyl hydrolase [Cellulomonas aerilata]
MSVPAGAGGGALRTTVVVPAYDEERLLGACLRSLARQTRPPHEVVVVDNNSRDRTAALARAYGARVVTEAVQGIWPAAATGYDAATGDLIARCDADCELPPDWVERIERAFAADPGLRALTGPGVFAELPRVRRALADLLYMRPYFVLVGLALGHPPLFGSNLAMRASAWADVRDQVHAGSDAVHDDIDLSFHIGRGRQVRLDRSLRVAISARPFRDARGMVQRVVKGVRSVRIHTPGDGPWARYGEKLLARTRRHRATHGTAPTGRPPTT